MPEKTDAPTRAAVLFSFGRNTRDDGRRSFVTDGEFRVDRMDGIFKPAER